MRIKKSILIVCIAVCLFAMAGVCAGDVNDTAIGPADEKLEASADDIQVIEEADDGESIGETDNGTFQALNIKIQNAPENTTVILANDYKNTDGFDAHSIVISKSLTIDGKGHTIDANYKAGIFSVWGHNVSIKNITFINSKLLGSAIIWGGVNGSVSGCVFANNFAEGSSGGAIRWNNGDNGVVSDCIFVNNSASGRGGAVWWMGDNGRVSDCVFENNFAGEGYEGGAISWDHDGGVVSGCVFVNNTAQINGGAIYWVSSQGSVFNSVFLNNSGNNGVIHFANQYWCNNLTINGNIFLNNNACAIYFSEIDSTSNADYNWFGSNSTNCYAVPVTNNVTLHNWLFLNATANPSSFSFSDSSEILFKLYLYGPDGISEYNNSKLPINLKITAINGDINKNIAELAEKITFTPTEVGNGRVTATLGHASLTVNLTIAKAPTAIEASPVTATFNSNKYLTVTLRDDKGNPLAGASVTVNINGIKTYVTDKNGQIKVKTQGIVPKTYTAKISFGGNANYAQSAKDVKITIKKAKPKLAAKNKKFKKSKKVKKYAVTLKDANKKPIKKAKLTLKIKGKKAITVKTNKKGKATFKIKKLTKKGRYTAKVTFKGDKCYAKLAKKVKITVK